jgi:hypothetical protein
LADLLTQVILDFAREKGITFEEAKKVFVSAMDKFGKKIADGTLEYDPHLDPFHPMHGWKP